MIETYTRCAACKTDARLGVEIHCVLCHANYPKGEQHRCAVLDAAVAETKTQTFSEYQDDFEDGLRSDPKYPLGVAHYAKHIFEKAPCDCSRELFASAAFQLGSIDAEAARVLSFDESVDCVIIPTSPSGSYKRAIVIEQAEREPHTPFHGRPCEPVTFHPTELVKE